MDKVSVNIWAKTSRVSDGKWHPLILHMLDVATSADAILAREPESTRNMMAAVLGMEWEDAKPWLLLLVACHDLGKACPGFQGKWLDMTGLRPSRSPNTDINHGFVSQIALTQLLQERDWPEDMAILVSDAVGCHHGNRAAPTTLDRLMGDTRAIGCEDWAMVRRSLVDTLIDVLKPANIPVKQTLLGADFMLLSGITSFADWIGSNEEWFPFGTTEDCGDLSGWFKKRRAQADRALDAISWKPRTPLSPAPKSFKEVFGFEPRPLQLSVTLALAQSRQPAILLVEAPMGEGKTEAAFFAHLELQRLFGHRGMYIALPSKATGNAMFKRTLTFLQEQRTARTLDLQLLHGATLLNETFQDLRLSGVHGSTEGSEIRAEEWFTHKKRALLSEYGVGTVDQALLPILPVRHNFVRLWGLANRVVVFDEIHAYDAYTGTILIHLLTWLLALGSSVVLLSATLPPSFRRKLACMVGASMPDQEAEYPRISSFSPGAVEQIHFVADPARRQTLRLLGIPPELAGIRSSLDEHLAKGGMGLALVNTVQRAQDLYQLFPEGKTLSRDGHNVGKRLSDGTEIFLFHARFPAEQRQKREDQALETFGETKIRNGRKILIATQVVEQSLDIDFDLMVTDLAPIDLVLQRAGRLWRHSRGNRPLPGPLLIVAGLDCAEPCSFGKPLWWGAVYREDILLRTWCLMRGKESLTLPDEIDDLVQAVYEERVDIPEFLKERFEKALQDGEGNACALKGQANQAIIGLPGDASWNQPERFVLFDEDEPGVHRTLMAQTRLGGDSVVAVALRLEDGFNLEAVPDNLQARCWSLHAMSISRIGVVKRLKKLGVPEVWKKSPLLRNCFPMVLTADGHWSEDEAVRLDDDLGLVYQSKEAE